VGLPPRLLVAALVCFGLAGCAFESLVTARFEGASPVVVTESFAPSQIPHRVSGRTTRAGQVARIDCSTTIVYDVREASGVAVLAQTYAVRLRTRRLPRGTAYDLDCTGPVILELPAEASHVRATTERAELSVRTGSVGLAFGKRLRSEPRTQLALVRWPRTLPRGDYRIELAFELPDIRTIRQKVLVTASVSCGRSRYVQPILPAVTSFARVRALTIRPSAETVSFQLPRIAGGITSYVETTRTLSCRR
jgi:hypothetical protein